MSQHKKSLTKRALGSGSWTMLETLTGNALRLASNLIMTRLLMPDAFSLMAMIGTLHVGLTLFTDIGIRQSVVRSKRGDDTAFLQTAWALQSMRGVVIALIICCAGAALWVTPARFLPADTVYADPRLPLLIILSSPNVLLNGIASINIWHQHRKIQFARVTIMKISAQVIGLASMVVFAWFNPTVWALLAGMLTGTLCMCVLSHLVLPGTRPVFRMERAAADELWTFGKWLLGSSFLTFITQYADRLLIGGLIPSREFGFYAIAIIAVNMAITLVRRICNATGYSVFSEVHRSRPQDMPKVYRKVSLVTDVICICWFVVLFFGAELIVDILYPDTYSAVKNYIPILAFGVLSARFTTLNMLILSAGDSKNMMLVSACSAVAVCVAIPVGFHFMGLAGALWGTALSPLVGAPLLIWRARPILHRHIGIDIVWLITIIMAAAIAATQITFAT